MTPRQSQLLTYIRDYTFLHGYAPTLEEMKQTLRLNTLSTVHEHLRCLVKQGYLKNNGYKRGYELPSKVAVSSSVAEVISSIVRSMVFKSLSEHGISSTAAMESSRKAEVQVSQLLQQKHINV